MDPLTHAAVGLFLSRAGLNRWTPRATPILILAAEAPDIDIVTLAGGALGYLHYHRHLTHSLIMMPVMALLPVALVRAAGRKPIRWAGAFCAALVGVASHLLLDLTNTWGVRLFLPFSSAWQRLDLTNVVDPWIWAALFLGISGPFLSRLVGGEIESGRARPKSHGRGFAIFALLFVLVYNCGRAELHARAVAVADARDYRGAAPARVAAVPSAANPLRWQALIETDDFYALAPVDLTQDFDPARAAVYYKPESNPAFDAARATPAFRYFLQFAQFPLWRATPAAELENGQRVELTDMRFGPPDAPLMMASALVDRANRVVKSSLTFPPSRR